LVTVVLGASGILYVITDRGLYVDGSLYLLEIIDKHGFFHVSSTRVSATFLNQASLVMSLWAGVTSLRVLAHMQALSLALVPLTAYAVALWVARRSPPLLGGTIVVVTTVFYPTSFVLNGEFHILYSLYWLSFVILLSGAADCLPGACLLLGLGFGLMRSYEVSLLLCLILAALSLWRGWLIKQPPVAPVLLVCSGVFLIGVGFGLWGVVHPRSVAAVGSFSYALRTIQANHPLLAVADLALVGCAAGFVQGTRNRAFALLGLMAMAAIFLCRRIGSQTVLGLGEEFNARAQVVPILMVVSCVCLLWPYLQRLSERRWQPWFLLVPLLAVFVVDSNDSFGWQRFLGSMCEELGKRAEGQGDPAFAQRDLSRKFGWDWTYPTLSVLLRPPGSDAVVSDATYHGWLPPSPIAHPASLDSAKREGALCGGRWRIN